MSLTREDLNAELERFATKDDLARELERFATKDDLQRFATKDDLQRFATKDDLRRFATKEDVCELREETAQGFADLRRYMEIIAEDLKSTVKLSIEVGIGRDEALDRRLSTKLENHKRRIGSLEGQVAILGARRGKRR